MKSDKNTMLCSLLFNPMLKVLAIAKGNKNITEIKNKKEVKLPVFVDDMILYYTDSTNFLI